MDQGIIYETVGRIIVRLWAGRFVYIIIVIFLAIFKPRITNGIGIPDKAYAAGAASLDMAAADRNATVVIADKDRIAAQLVKFAVRNAAVFCPAKKHRSAAVDCPVTSQKRFLGFHKRPCGMPKPQSGQRDIADRLFLCALELNKVTKSYDLEDGRFYINILIRHIIERMIL